MESTQKVKKGTRRRIRRYASISSVLLMGMIALASVLPAVSASATVGPNVNVAGDAGGDRQIVEPTIAVDPRNPAIIVAGANDFRNTAHGGDGWDGYYRSTDGGATWSSALVPGFPGDNSPKGQASPLRFFNGSGDVGVAFDRSGNLYYDGLVLNSTESAFSLPARHGFKIFVAKFANDGADFVGATLLSNQGMALLDFPKIAVDATGGPNDGNVYETWSSVGNGYFSRSTDGGRTFSDPIQVRGGGLPAYLTVDPSGDVYVVSIQYSRGAIWVEKSTDGGQTFLPPVVVSPMTPDPQFPGNGFFASSDPQIAADENGVYIVWDDYGTGDANILFTRSTDGGATWSTPVTLNDVTQGQQFFSAIAVAGGVVSVAWYDSRLGQLPSGQITNLDVFYTQSKDAGLTFSKNIRVTSASFDPNEVSTSFTGNPADAFQFIGDYISIAATPGAVHPIWTDNRNACDTLDPNLGCVDQDAMTATITP